MLTEDDCIAAIQAAADRLSSSPTKLQYEALGLSPSSSSIVRLMGSWNRAKRAAGVDTFPQGMGGGPSIQEQPEDVELSDGYEWTELNPQQRWYYKNREHRIAVKTRRKNKLRAWLTAYKASECSCEECSEDHPACLEFHHVGEKRMGISEMVSTGFAKNRIMREIAACRVLCANCHRKEHHGSILEGVENDSI